MKRYALALVVACCALAGTQLALADDGGNPSSPSTITQSASCATRADLEAAFAHRRWRQEHPARGIDCYDASLNAYAHKLRHGFFTYADRQFRACSPADCKVWARRFVSGVQFHCLDALWERESGWRRLADNPESSAHGIPEALPGSKMGPGWYDDGKVQIRWGLSYIHSNYGSPCTADSSQSAQGWY